MRELTVQEMDQTSGGIGPVIGLLLAVAGAVVRHQTAATVIGVTGVGYAGYELGQWSASNNAGACYRD